MLFPKIDFILDDNGRGGMYAEDSQTIVIYSQFSKSQSFWIFRVIFHEYLHHIFEICHCLFMNNILHQKNIRRLLS